MGNWYPALYKEIWGERDAFGYNVFDVARVILLLQRPSAAFPVKLVARCELGMVSERARIFAGDLLLIYLRLDEIDLSDVCRELCRSLAIDGAIAQCLIGLQATPPVKLLESPNRGAIACYCFSNAPEERSRMVSLWQSSEDKIRAERHLFEEYTWMLSIEKLCP